MSALDLLQPESGNMSHVQPEHAEDWLSAIRPPPLMRCTSALFIKNSIIGALEFGQ
jgi:hypothetical protein